MTAKVLKLKRQVPPAPAHLPARVKAQWDALAPGLAARGLLTPENLPLVAAYCGDLAVIADADEVMSREGMTITGADGVTRPHPMARPRAMAAARAIQFGKRLHLFTARETPKGKKAKDPYAALGIR